MISLGREVAFQRWSLTIDGRKGKFVCTFSPVDVGRTVQSVKLSSICSLGTGESIPNSPSEMDKELREGLTPVETAVVVTASVVGASSLPCLLYLLLSRRRPRTRKRRISPEGDTEEEWPSEISDLSDINPDLNVVVNRAYVLHGESRTHRSPRENWVRAKELTMPKHVPQGAWF